MDFFKKVEQAPPDSILGLRVKYLADSRSNKVDLGAGVYKTDALEPYILKSVKKAEQSLLDQEMSKDYLPIDGLSDYVFHTQTLVFGKNEGSIYGAQTPGGTAALHIGALLLKELGLPKVYIPKPTWANHFRIFNHAGLMVEEYPYFNAEKLAFDFEEMLQSLQKMSRGSIVLLQACCHNPTGFDPTVDQWKSIAEIVKKRELFALFDVSYQGFADGLHDDVKPVRLFFDEGIHYAVAVSHAKNFGLYAERCGVLYLICKDDDEVDRVSSRVKILIRGLYSNPPCHGARIVSTILNNDNLKILWEQEVAIMRTRICEMRKFLALLLTAKQPHFDFLSKQKGMFSYTGLSKQQVQQLVQDYGIYLPEDGRINVAGLNHDNLSYVANAILNTLTHEKSAL